MIWRITEEESLEPCGFVGDEYACPPDLEAEWGVLLDHWRESGEYTRACLATARQAYYFGLDPARTN